MKIEQIVMEGNQVRSEIVRETSLRMQERSAWCEAGHVSKWMGAEAGERYICPTHGCRAVVIIPPDRWVS